MDFPYHVRLREVQKVVVAGEIPGMVGKPLGAEVGLPETVPLDHRPHGSVQQENPLVEQALESLRRVGARDDIVHGSCRA